MSFVANVSVDQTREQQLLEVMERDPTLPRSPSDALKVVLWKALEEKLGVKKA